MFLVREAASAAGAVALAEPDEEESPIVGLVALVRHELMFHGLDWTVAEEIEQEIALWLVRKWPSLEVPRLPAAFAAAVVKQFLRPDNLRRWGIEERVVPEAAGPHSSLRCASADDGKLAAAEWMRTLGPRDRPLAARLLSGDSWIQACDKENVPAGSRAFRRKRLKASLPGAC